MDTIKKMLLIFVVNTLVMLISWAGLSLIIFGVRVFTSPQAGLVKMLSIHSYIVVMFCYAFYLIFDLCEYFSTQSRFEKMKGQMLKESTKRRLESKLRPHFWALARAELPGGMNHAVHTGGLWWEMIKSIALVLFDRQVWIPTCVCTHTSLTVIHLSTGSCGKGVM